MNVSRSISVIDYSVPHAHSLTDVRRMAAEMFANEVETVIEVELPQAKKNPQSCGWSWHSGCTASPVSISVCGIAEIARGDLS